MPLDNPFTNEWRECLRAHYMHVIRTQDKVTERTLTNVLRRAGFDEQELAELRVRATLRVEDVPEDFVPDLEVLEEQTAAQVEAELKQAEIAAEAAAAPPPETSVEAEPPADDYYAPPDDTPRQLSLF